METFEDELEQFYLDRGIERGRRDERRDILLRQLRKRFSELPGTAVDRVKAADMATLETWLDRFVTATSLDEIWAES